MGFKVRGYEKSAKQEKTRDYSLFAIATEGVVREPEYFRPFNEIDRIKVDVIEDKIGNSDSAPKKILERVQMYIEEVGLSEQDNDTLWCVIDVDTWPREQIDELAEFCNSNSNWNIIISNPCFEVWLLYHKLKSLKTIDASKSHNLKRALHDLQKGGYYYLEYLPLLKDAVSNAAMNDTASDHYYPNDKETKVYLLGKALLDKIGNSRFDKFVTEYLPTLVSKKTKGSKKKK